MKGITQFVVMVQGVRDDVRDRWILQPEWSSFEVKRILELLEPTTTKPLLKLINYQLPIWLASFQSQPFNIKQA